MVEDAKKQKDVERAKKEEPKSEKKEIKSQQPAKEVEEKKGKVLSSEEEKRSEEKETKKDEEMETIATQLTPEAEKIIKTVESMSVLELSNLVKALEKKFGVSAQAPVIASAATQPTSTAAEPKEEEKSSFDIILKEIGPKKIQVIKEIRAITTLGLKEAKDLVEQAPKSIKEGVSKEEAEEIKKKLEAAGAKVELK